MDIFWVGPIPLNRSAMSRIDSINMVKLKMQRR
jgi:hypothetical protein